MPTPPSSSSSSSSKKLPSSSPSSARLRRIAPSPVKILKSSKSIAIAHAKKNQDSNNSKKAKSFINSPLFEFEPLELIILSSPDTQIRTLFEVLEDSKRNSNSYSSYHSNNNNNNKSSSKKLDFIPLIFDIKGEYGKLAYENKLKSLELDLPIDCDFEDDQNIEVISPIFNNKKSKNFKRRSGLTLLSPKKYLNQFDIPSPVLINFKEDIFNDSIFKKSNDTLENQSSVGIKEFLDHEIEKPRLDREDSIQTFNTFGINRNNQFNSNSILLGNDNYEDDCSILDNWSFTLSAYEEELNPSFTTGSPSLYRKDSFFAFNGNVKTNSTLGEDVYDSNSSIYKEIPKDIVIETNISSDDSSFIPPLPSYNDNVLSVKSLEVNWANVRKSQYETNAPLSDIVIIPNTFPTVNQNLSISNNITQDTPTPTIKNPKSIRSRSRIISTEKKIHYVPLTQSEQANSSLNGNVDIDSIENALKTVDKEMTIQLWVDQEGCREVRSTLKYIKSIKPCIFREREEKSLKEATEWCESPTRPESFQQTGCWEFGMNPKERDKWSFHHAALEGLPVLRRLTINNDDKFDFLSRSATLQIKEPGVYSVCGQEERGKSEWKFEYLVQNKISINSGEQILNERIIIPLGLYVSPNFFNPERALKTSLLNLFKKTLTSNIMSEKVKPPHIGKPPMKNNSNIEIDQHIDNPDHDCLSDKKDIGNIGRKRSQTQIESSIINHESHSRSVSKTIGAIAKAVVGKSNSSTAHTPTQPQHQDNLHTSTTPKIVRPSSAGLHKFGTKAPSFGRSTIGSRSKTPITSTFTIDSTIPSEESGDKKKGIQINSNRKRSTSLFSRSRPFTPPTNITQLHPVPQLTTKHSSFNSSSVSSPSTEPRLNIGTSINSTSRSSILGVPTINNQTSISLPLQPHSHTKSTNKMDNSNSNSIDRSNVYQSSSNTNTIFLQPNFSTPNGIYNPPNSNLSNSSLISNKTGSSSIISPLNTPLLSRSSSITYRSKPIIHTQQQTNEEERDTISIGKIGTFGFVKRGIKKRPSTAEPRLGIK
ncbi:uncharacterized protein I206_107836 [Kwoniella pini CBS 10737]|uniref:Uncharacterized protein n=1 Tax=Kwoniella pini CBS 10737 TaxID=1296096 RepID=A0A1B9HYG0_9TREE|nr:uncharacterized protein I206_06168 [Kwoniella pini CBS 10737]OCF48300.1 hypothetical protein I206_06168 [Kwoniella pini CBS 10737]